MSESVDFESRDPGVSGGQDGGKQEQGCGGWLLPALGGIWLLVGGILLWVF